MLEHVGESSLSPFFVPGSHPVPNLEGDQGRFVIFQEDYFQAIGQDGFKNTLLKAGLCQWDEEKEKEKKR